MTAEEFRKVLYDTAEHFVKPGNIKLQFIAPKWFYDEFGGLIPNDREHIILPNNFKEDRNANT